MDKMDMNDLIKKYEPVVKKTGEQLAKAVKNAEDDIVKMYKVAQTHVELQMKNLQREKLYYDLGKYVAQRLADNTLDVAGLEKFKSELLKIASEGDRIKKKLSKIDAVRKRKKGLSEK